MERGIFNNFDIAKGIVSYNHLKTPSGLSYKVLGQKIKDATFRSDLGELLWLVREMCFSIVAYEAEPRRGKVSPVSEIREICASLNLFIIQHYSIRDGVLMEAMMSALAPPFIQTDKLAEFEQNMTNTARWLCKARKSKLLRYGVAYYDSVWSTLLDNQTNFEEPLRYSLIALERAVCNRKITPQWSTNFNDELVRDMVQNLVLAHVIWSQESVRHRNLLNNSFDETFWEKWVSQLPAISFFNSKVYGQIIQHPVNNRVRFAGENEKLALMYMAMTTAYYLKTGFRYTDVLEYSPLCSIDTMLVHYSEKPNQERRRRNQDVGLDELMIPMLEMWKPRGVKRERDNYVSHSIVDLNSLSGERLCAYDLTAALLKSPWLYPLRNTTNNMMKLPDTSKFRRITELDLIGKMMLDLTKIIVLKMFLGLDELRIEDIIVSDEYGVAMLDVFSRFNNTVASYDMSLTGTLSDNVKRYEYQLHNYWHLESLVKIMNEIWPADDEVRDAMQRLNLCNIETKLAIIRNNVKMGKEEVVKKHHQFLEWS